MIIGYFDRINMYIHMINIHILGGELTAVARLKMPRSPDPEARRLAHSRSNASGEGRDSYTADTLAIDRCGLATHQEPDLHVRMSSSSRSDSEMSADLWTSKKARFFVSFSNFKT